MKAKVSRKLRVLLADPQAKGKLLEVVARTPAAGFSKGRSIETGGKSYQVRVLGARSFLKDVA